MGLKPGTDNDMALTERGMELVKLSAREAAFTAIKESDGTLRMTMREEARPIAKAEATAQARLSVLRMIILALVAGGGGGLVTNLPEIIKVMTAFLK